MGKEKVTNINNGVSPFQEVLWVHLSLFNLFLSGTSLDIDVYENNRRLLIAT